MKVVDAGVVVELLVGGLDPGALGDEFLAAPHLIDSEVLNVLRTLSRRQILTDEQADAAFAGFAALAIERFPADWLRPRIWQLRHNFSASDATYVALAEALSADCLLTTDARLTSAPGAACEIQLVG